MEQVLKLNGLYDILQTMIGIVEEDEVAETTIGTGIDHPQMRRLAPVPNRAAAFQPDLELNGPKITRLVHPLSRMVLPLPLQA